MAFRWANYCTLVFKKIRNLLDDESILVLALGLCLGMVFVATSAGFSPALGAFVMGSILAETKERHKIEMTIKPVQNLFSAVFFVSVGMLFDIDALIKYWDIIILLSIVLILGKIVCVFLGGMIAGQSLKHSIQAGTSLAQIGEFSFIIATLGLTLGVISEFLYPLAVAVSVVTAFTTPYLILSSGWIYKTIEQLLPKNIFIYLDYSKVVENPIKEGSRATINLIVNIVLVIAVCYSAALWFKPFLIEKFRFSKEFSDTLSLILALAVSTPFLMAIIFEKNNISIYKSLDKQDASKVIMSIFSIFGRVGVVVLLFIFFAQKFEDSPYAFVISVSVFLILGILGFNKIRSFYSWIEDRILTQIESDKLQENMKDLGPSAPIPKLSPWERHLSKAIVNANSSVVGKSLLTLGLKESVGVTIVMIERGDKKILAPKKDALLMAGDCVYAIGSDEQLTYFAQQLESKELEQNQEIEVGLTELQIGSESPFLGRSIRTSGIREQVDGLVVGVQRNQMNITNPSSDLVISSGDRLWIVGNIEKIKLLSANAV